MQRRQDGFKAHLADGARHRHHHRLRADQGQREPTNRDSTHEWGWPLLDGEDSPVTVLADSAYGAGYFRDELAGRGHNEQVEAGTGTARSAGWVHPR